MTSISLCMIVKNEAQVIRRCLASVKPFIDYWVIVDTGSTDGTQAMIRDFLEGIPGELHERPWKNFGHNRTEALRLAEGKADYLLLCDADMSLEVHDPNWKQTLDADAYLVTQRHDNLCYRNIRLVNARLSGNRRWRYWGSTHEYCGPVNPASQVSKVATDAISLLDYADGGSKQDKFARDAALLERDLETLSELERQAREAPDRADIQEALAEQRHLLPRTVFYLAQTYRDMGLVEKSIAMYERRVALEGWVEEVWYSLYQIAVLRERQAADSSQVLDAYLKAYQYRPQRAEPLVQLARYYREKSQYALAHLFAQQAKNIPRPSDILFLENAAYEWRSLDEYAIACYWIGDYRESENACRHLLGSGLLPETQKPRVLVNLNWALRQQSLPEFGMKNSGCN